jgi:hypothetical protein
MNAPNDRDVYMNATFTSSSNGNLKGGGYPKQEVTFSEKPTAADKTKFINITLHNNGTASNGMTALGKLKGISAANAALMTPPTTESRTDPQLSVQPIYDAAANGGSVVIHNAVGVMTKLPNTNTFDLETLRDKYEGADKSTFYLGTYMVIEVTSSISFSGDPGIFDANIIYIVKDGGTISAGGNFYSNSENSTTSTLVYAGAGNATLNQFGTKGNFRGFVYIDEKNCAQNHISFSGDKAKITGAIHNFSNCLDKPLGWNTGASNYSMPINYDKNVLKDFGPLYQAKSGNNTSSSNNGVIIKSGGIEVKPLGYYFY